MVRAAIEVDSQGSVRTTFNASVVDTVNDAGLPLLSAIVRVASVIVRATVPAWAGLNECTLIYPESELSTAI